MQIEAFSLLKKEHIVFRRFPRAEPPASEEERWEWLAFWLYSSLCEGHGHATACLNQISYAQGRST